MVLNEIFETRKNVIDFFFGKIPIVVGLEFPFHIEFEKFEFIAGSAKLFGVKKFRVPLV